MDRFEANVQDNQERFLAELQEFCRKPSIIAQNIGIEETADWVCNRLRSVGFESKVISVEGGAPVVYGEMTSSPQNPWSFGIPAPSTPKSATAASGPAASQTTRARGWPASRL